MKRNTEINMSEWNLDRIQAEQDKHMSFKVTGSIPKVDTKQVECNLTELDNALDSYMRKVAEDTDMYIICELAKMYVESQRPAEWEESVPEHIGVVGEGIDIPTYECSNPYCAMAVTKRTLYCPNCGRRMKNG